MLKSDEQILAIAQIILDEKCFHYQKRWMNTKKPMSNHFIIIGLENDFAEYFYFEKEFSSNDCLTYAKVGLVNVMGVIKVDKIIGYFK